MVRSDDFASREIPQYIAQKTSPTDLFRRAYFSMSRILFRFNVEAATWTRNGAKSFGPLIL